LFTSFVLSNGTLDGHKIIKKEKLYKGMNGRFVERFYLTPKESYIFKPLTNEAQIGKEVWIHKNILAEFPPIYPKIIAHSISENAEENWMILEDLGRLRHEFNKELVIGVTKWMAWWHSFPIEMIMNASLKGPKPMIEEIVANIILKKEKVIELLTKYDFTTAHIENIFFHIEKKSFSKTKVLSHGDLHLGNYGYAGERIVVLDWEHTHINSPYWDLYHLLDMSHPVFPRIINMELRRDILELYLVESKYSANLVDREAFKLEYYLFSTAFSIWMLLLIQADLNRNETKWSKNQLNQQLLETLSSLKHSVEEFK
jgi:thiamine kinase-like enzyme